VSGERARLFVALELPEPVRLELARWGELVARAQPGLRLVDADALHVTLCFLGSHGIDQLERIGEACDVVGGAGAVELSLGSALCLPPRRPRVVAVKLRDPDGALGAIQATLAAALVSASVYEPERRAFLPHITVARVRRAVEAGRGRVAGEAGLRASDLLRPPELSLTGSAITLYRSRLGGAGARYEPQRTVHLTRALAQEP
jgi:2'-5' RNA ligase